MPSSLNSSSTNLLVIGAGLPRTGTMSQRVALERLLNNKCYHMFELSFDTVNKTRLWQQAVNDGLTKELADRLFAGYVATTDYPGSAFYKELIEYYPNAKVILSTRDAKSWVKSMRSTVLGMWAYTDSLPGWFQAFFDFSSGNRLQYGLFQRGLGLDMLRASDEELERAFHAHVESVRRAVPKERLLEFKVQDGWMPLCRFLDLPVPDESFPRMNDTEEFKGYISKVRTMWNATRCLLWLGAAASVALLSRWAYLRIIVDGSS